MWSWNDYHSSLCLLATFTVYTHSLAGSLDQLLDKGGPFTELTVRNYTGQIIRGVAYLHENGIIHRDLKGANILVNQTGESVLIADFGTAATLKTSTTVTGEFKDTKGTAPFMAPEVGYIQYNGQNHAYIYTCRQSLLLVLILWCISLTW